MSGVQRIADADGLFHISTLPVGQGDAHVIQCPNGDLSIVDFGTSDGVAAGFWFNNELTAFLQARNKQHLVAKLCSIRFDWAVSRITIRQSEIKNG